MKHQDKQSLLIGPRRYLLRSALVCGLLILLTFSAFNTALDNDFIDYDDSEYVTENPHVLQGLTLHNIKWAFTSLYMSNWHPLTWLSHMLDVGLYGLNPAGHHLTSLFLHTAVVLLLFFWLHRSTGRFWPSFLVAAIFAVHPLRTESVAWIAERKDVLSALFGMLTLCAYGYYAQKRSFFRYLAIFFFFALGLMSKPMLVTWPFVLLLVDFWPLGRIRGYQFLRSTDTVSVETVSIRQALLEKLPMLPLILGACVITYIAQNTTNAVMELDHLSVWERIQNAVFGYYRYLGKTFYPRPLCLLYPISRDPAPLRLILGIGGLVSLSVFFVLQYRHRPWLSIGWFWFLGTLVPVIGLVQVGIQAIADRYTYLPSIGLLILIVWTAAEWILPKRIFRLSAVALAGSVILLLLIMTWIQVYHWRNSITIFRHTTELTRNNYAMEINYAVSLQNAGLYDQSLQVIQEVIKQFPERIKPLLNLASLYLYKGKPDMAIETLEGILSAHPDSTDNNSLYSMLGVAYARTGRPQQAIEFFEKALALNPEDTKTLSDLGFLQRKLGNSRQAIETWNRALAVDAFCWPVLRNLAWTLATSPDNTIRQPDLALEYAQRDQSLDRGRTARSLDILAAAQAANGRFDLAVQIARQAIETAYNTGQDDLAKVIELRLALYEQNRAYQEPNKNKSPAP